MAGLKLHASGKTNHLKSLKLTIGKQKKAVRENKNLSDQEKQDELEIIKEQFAKRKMGLDDNL